MYKLRIYENTIKTEKIQPSRTSEYFARVLIAMLCDNWTNKIFVSACFFSDISNLRGGSMLKTMKEIYIFNC
jgi:hypothetical protein